MPHLMNFNYLINTHSNTACSSHMYLINTAQQYSVLKSICRAERQVALFLSQRQPTKQFGGCRADTRTQRACGVDENKDILCNAPSPTNCEVASV
jgi:hypothetical protein